MCVCVVWERASSFLYPSARSFQLIIQFHTPVVHFGAGGAAILQAFIVELLKLFLCGDHTLIHTNNLEWTEDEDRLMQSHQNIDWQFELLGAEQWFNLQILKGMQPLSQMSTPGILHTSLAGENVNIQNSPENIQNGPGKVEKVLNHQIAGKQPQQPAGNHKKKTRNTITGAEWNQIHHTVTGEHDCSWE